MPSRPVQRLRLVPPQGGDVLRALGSEASPAQHEALSALSTGQDVVVHAAPGGGRTRLALTAALAAPRALLLVPRRTSSTALRDAVAHAGGARHVRVATPVALGFSVVREASLRAGGGEPSLVTGADQDALVRELVAATAQWEVPLDAATRALPGFRDELRDLITRATELGITPDHLVELAGRRGRPAWRDAARLLRLYLDVLDLEAEAALDAGPRLDSGRMVRRAAGVLRDEPAPVGELVVVDDAQDLTAAGVALVRALRERGAQLLLTTCPDEAVDTFRGALPDAAERILARGTGHGTRHDRPVRTILLPRSLRSPASAAPVLAALRSRLPLAGAPTGARRPAEATGATHPGPSAVAVLTAPSALEEARRIATVLRDLHHGEGEAYDDMAVICRSGSAVDELADLLQRQGLPVTAARRPRPLREEPVVADLLAIIELALSGGVPSAEDAAALLRGPFGDADALRLRRIRRLLLRARAGGAGLEGEDLADSAELLARALVEDMPGLPAPEERDRAAAPVHRVRRMIAAVRALGPSPAAADALWAAWDAAHVAEGWRTASLDTDDLEGAGARGRLAARRLDAMTALFASVERFTDRRPGADALVFAEHVRDLAVAEDTLAAPAQLVGRVRVMTPAALAGEEVATVVLAHVQEGSWPNTRLRSTLFGAAELAIALEDPDLPLEPAALRAVQREAVIADELRLAVSAIARARSRILVTAVDGQDEAPSALLEVIAHVAAQTGSPWADPEAASADPGPAPDPRRLVAALRRRLVDPSTSEEERGESAALLARLAAAGAPGADPASWYHQDPTTDADILDPGVPVRLSPSALERAYDCPQAWLLERSGGSPTPGPSQSIGTAIHRLAQDHPAGSADRASDGTQRNLLADLTRLLAPLHLERSWSTRRLLVRAEEAVRLLADHLLVAGPPLAVEAPFTITLGDVELRGTMDRVEGDATGLRVVDLKTGRTAKTRAAAAEDLQLAAYQAAIRDGALDDVLGADAGERLGGAQLVYLGTGGKSPAIRTQGALAAAEDPRWFDETVAAVAHEVRGAHVSARRTAHCDRCTVRRTCALWPEGEQL